MIKHDDVLYLVQVGVLPVDDSKVTMKGRLGPGMMISVDLLGGQVCKALVFFFSSIRLLLGFVCDEPLKLRTRMVVQVTNNCGFIHRSSLQNDISVYLLLLLGGLVVK